MDIKTSELNDFCNRLQALEKDKKALSDEIKDSIDTFANANELTKKSVNKFYKEWKEAQKDKEEYTLVDLESDQLLLIAFPEFAGAPEDGEDD